MKAVGMMQPTVNEVAMVIERLIIKTKYFIPEIICKSYSKMWVAEPWERFESELMSIAHMNIGQMLRCHYHLLLG